MNKFDRYFSLIFEVEKIRIDRNRPEENPVYSDTVLKVSVSGWENESFDVREHIARIITRS